MTFAELKDAYSGPLAISQKWKTFWMDANCMVCLLFIYVGTTWIEKSEFVPSHHVFTQWLLKNTQVPAQGINVYASINAYEFDSDGNLSPGGPDLYATVGHKMVDRAFVIGSYFWYIHSFSKMYLEMLTLVSFQPVSGEVLVNVKNVDMFTRDASKQQAVFDKVVVLHCYSWSGTRRCWCCAKEGMSTQ